jgi:low affinity Fe/Cu permease
MVFLIRNNQNRDGSAIQTKLDGLIRSSDAEDEFMGIETLTEAKLTVLHQKCEDAAHRTSELLTKTNAKWQRRKQSSNNVKANQHIRNKSSRKHCS